MPGGHARRELRRQGEEGQSEPCEQRGDALGVAGPPGGPGLRGPSAAADEPRRGGGGSGARRAVREARQTAAASGDTWHERGQCEGRRDSPRSGVHGQPGRPQGRWPLPTPECPPCDGTCGHDRTQERERRGERARAQILGTSASRDRRDNREQHRARDEPDFGRLEQGTPTCCAPRTSSAANQPLEATGYVAAASRNATIERAIQASAASTAADAPAARERSTQPSRSRPKGAPPGVPRS